MRLGYNTNGFPHHTLADAIEVLAEIGYRSVAITLDHQALNPFDSACRRQVTEVRDQLQRWGLSVVIETGARFLLDRWQKHEPTLVSAAADGRARRVDFLCRAVDLAAELSASCISLWSGVVRDSAAEEVIWERLICGLERVAERAVQRGVVLGFEPEPGMFIDTMVRFDQLRGRLPHPALQLTLDIGHLHCLGETPLPERIVQYAPWLVNVHLEDMRRGIHEHLMFGEGELDFPPVLAALRQIDYRGGVHVELSRHGHEAPSAARRAWDFLQRCWPADPHNS